MPEVNNHNEALVSEVQQLGLDYHWRVDSDLYHR